MCCNGGNRSIRTTKVDKPKPQKRTIVQQRIQRDVKTTTPLSIDRSVSAKRQALVQHDRCPKCEYPVMLVNIAGRERKQCTGCRYIIK